MVSDDEDDPPAIAPDGDGFAFEEDGASLAILLCFTVASMDRWQEGDL